LVALGLQDVIRVVRTFPGNSSSGFFFHPGNEEEQKMVDMQLSGVVWEDQGPSCCNGDEGRVDNLKELYLRSNPQFSGVVTVRYPSFMTQRILLL